MDNRTDANFQLNLYTLILLTVILVITYGKLETEYNYKK